MKVILSYTLPWWWFIDMIRRLGWQRVAVLRGELSPFQYTRFRSVGMAMLYDMANTGQVGFRIAHRLGISYMHLWVYFMGLASEAEYDALLPQFAKLVHRRVQRYQEILVGRYDNDIECEWN